MTINLRKILDIFSSESTRNGISKHQNFNIFWGRMPLEPPGGLPLWCSHDSLAIKKYLDFTYSVLNGWTVCIITRTRQHGKMCKTNHSTCTRISVIIALHTLQKHRNQDFIWINFMKWYESWELHELAGSEEVKNLTMIFLSQSYSNLTYLCLSSVRASKRSLYIFRAFSPSTSHIFNQDLTLKKHQCQHCQHWIFLQLFYLKLTHFWRKIHVEEKKKTHPLLKENTCRRKKKKKKPDP